MPVRLTVRRHSFTIACEKGGEEAMRQAAKTVEETIGEVRDKWQVADGERAAIMAALTLAHAPQPHAQTDAETANNNAAANNNANSGAGAKANGANKQTRQTMEQLCRRIDAALLRTAPRGRASEA